MVNKSHTLAVLAGLPSMACLALLLSGCGLQPGAGPWMDLPAEPPQAVSDAELFYTLVAEPGLINQNRAYHAFLVWIDGKDESKNFGQRIVALEQRNVLDPNWAHDPLKPLTRGRLASMICRKMNIRSSVALALLGPIGRSARRELVFRGIMTGGGGDLDGMSGAEFVNIVKRADEYEASQPARPPAGQPASQPAETAVE